MHLAFPPFLNPLRNGGIYYILPNINKISTRNNWLNILFLRLGGKCWKILLPYFEVNFFDYSGENSLLKKDYCFPLKGLIIITAIFKFLF